MAEVKLERARDLIEAWREDSSADVTVRSDEVEELVHFVRQKLRRRVGAGLQLTPLCPDCNRRKDDEELHPASDVCNAKSKSDGQEYLQLLMSFLESAMCIYDALTDTRDVEQSKDDVQEAKEQIRELEGEIADLKNQLSELEHEKDAADFALSELKVEFDELKKEREEEGKGKRVKDSDVKMLMSMANTALRYKDAESLRLFKAKLREVEASVY